MIRRLLDLLDRAVTRRLDREFTRAGVPTGHVTAGGTPRSTSPLSLVDRYRLTGLPDPKPRLHDHCPCCETRFAPAPCPLTHTLPCPDCGSAA